MEAGPLRAQVAGNQAPQGRRCLGVLRRRVHLHPPIPTGQIHTKVQTHAGKVPEADLRIRRAEPKVRTGARRRRKHSVRYTPEAGGAPPLPLPRALHPCTPAGVCWVRPQLRSRSSQRPGAQESLGNIQGKKYILAVESRVQSRTA